MKKVSRRFVVTQQHKDKALASLVILGVLALGFGNQAFAQVAGGAAVVTQISTFCATWVKPIYLGIVGLAVLAVCFQGGSQLMQQEGQGGQLIVKGLIGGLVAVALPAAVLTAVAATASFTC
ncbi:MAG: hypothetical protein RLZZ156_344 [Deinococcota bacterium]|jgi:hypothetical protein